MCEPPQQRLQKPALPASEGLPGIFSRMLTRGREPGDSWTAARQRTHGGRALPQGCLPLSPANSRAPRHWARRPSSACLRFGPSTQQPAAVQTVSSLPGGWWAGTLPAQELACRLAAASRASATAGTRPLCGGMLPYHPSLRGAEDERNHYS